MRCIWPILALILGLTPPAWAEQANQLHNIGLYPFTGTHADACRLHTSAHGMFTMDECMAAIVQSDNEEVCPKRAVLQEGTTWWMLFTDDAGVHHIGVYQISFGAQVPRDDSKRMVNDCAGVNAGQNMIKPHACGNYSVQYEAPPPAVQISEPVPRTPTVPAVSAPPTPQITRIPSSSAMIASGQGVSIFNATPAVRAYCQPCCQ